VQVLARRRSPQPNGARSRWLGAGRDPPPEAL